MAQRVQIVIEDDLEGGPADETVSFALDGVSYEIDLNKDNADSLRDQFANWVGAARRAGGRKTTGRRPGSGSSSKRVDLSAVRAWARDAGHQVSDRGRVPAAVLEAYHKAHG